MTVVIVCAALVLVATVLLLAGLSRGDSVDGLRLGLGSGLIAIIVLATLYGSTT